MNWFSVPDIFWLAALFSLIAIALLFVAVPTPSSTSFHQETEPNLNQLSSVIFQPLLPYLYISVFFLHIIFTATFVVVPISLEKLAGLTSHQQWKLYLPVMILAFLFSIPMIIHAEKKHLLKHYFIMAIFFFGIAEFFWWWDAKNLFLSALSLLLFLTAFSLLEAFLPSLISKSAPPSKKGTALGIYSCSQFLGIFVGGALGGWLYGAWSLNTVYLFCVIIAVIWVSMLIKMKSGDIHYGQRR